MRYLLDTHTFLWWVMEDRRLSVRARDIIADPDNEILFSAASAWEIAIKAQRGHFDFQIDPTNLVTAHVVPNGFVPLSVEIRHALRVYDLPRLHRDPFDRLLIAQAQVESLPLLTVDRAINQYDVPTVW